MRRRPVVGARLDRVPPGLRQEYPRRIAEQLTRRYGQLDRRALALVDELLIPAVAADDDVAIAQALSRIEDALVREWPDSRIEEEARRAAEQADRQHAHQFYRALGAVVGAKILGSDRPTPASTLLGGGVKPPTDLAGTPGGPPVPGVPTGGRGGRGRPNFAVRLNVGPELWADEFVNENVRYIGELRRGITKGLEDAVVRARKFGVEGVRGEGPDELARRLRATWAKNGVPSQLPTTRLKANGQPVMLSTSKHAQMVAEDQLAKLNGNLNQARQEASGIDEYVWETEGDSRVRPAHRALAGRRFTWSSGGAPGEGHPGQAPRCRCTARAVVDRGQVLERLVPL